MIVWSPPDLLGQKSAEAFEWPDSMRIAAIPKPQADAIIKAGHYSHSVVWSSSVHIGVWWHGEVIGALQYGPAMNPSSGGKVVSGTTARTFLELNRMWLSDTKPGNCASRAISGSLRLIHHWRPEVEWVQSFADERCGKFGAVYQACSFLYCGSHESKFYQIDGQWFHKSLLGRPEYDKRGWWQGPKAAWFNANKDRATSHVFRQFRYLRFIHTRAKSRLLLAVQPYPKPMQEAAA